MSYSNIDYDDVIEERRNYIIRTGLLKETTPDTNKKYQMLAFETDTSMIGGSLLPSDLSVTPLEMITEPLIRSDRIFLTGGLMSSTTGLYKCAFTLPQRSLNEALIQTIGGIEAVEKIYLIKQNEVNKVYTIINENNDDVKRLIYEREMNVLDELPMLRIEFHVIWRDGRNLDEIIKFALEPLY